MVKAEGSDRYFKVIFAMNVMAIMTQLTVWKDRSAEAVYEDGGDFILKQAIYMGLIVLTIVPLWLKRPQSLTVAMPRILWLPLAWFAVTLLWSPVPVTGLIRLTLTTAVLFSVVLTVDRLGASTTIEVFTKALKILTILSIATVILVPSLGIHQPSDPQKAIIGSWRGVFFHKNHFGSMLAVLLIISAFNLIKGKESKARAWTWVVTAGATLVLSGSKTSLGFAILSIGALLYINSMSSRGVRPGVAASVLAVFVLVIITPAAIIFSDQLASIEITDDSFTGRGLVWQNLWYIIEQNYLFGRGYQSLFGIGQFSVFNSGAFPRVLYDVPHAHDAYLEILASTGVIGLALVAVVYLSMMATAFRMYDREEILLHIAIYVFILFHSILEVGLFDRTRPMWLTLCVFWACTYQAKVRQRRYPVSQASSKKVVGQKLLANRA